MNTTRVCAILLLAVAACARPDAESADSAGMAAVGEDRGARAAAISNAIAANPAAADSILRSNNLTAAEYERMLYEVASDSAQSAAYAAARTP